jgi:hypothetical protein
MGEASITYFPVGNGDTSLVRLKDGTSILIDVCISTDDEDKYDVHGHLIGELRSEEGVPHLDAFILTHPDQDHIRGWSTYFYSGDPSNYSKSDKKEGRIVADEVWFAPRIFAPHEKELCQEARDFRKEVNRRIELFRKGSQASSLPGNRFRVAGFTDNPDLKGLEAFMTVPGNVTSKINTSLKNDFEIFVHAPTKKQSDAKWAERNDTSIVLQLRFKVGGDSKAVLAMFSGDAHCGIWSNIIEKSKTSDLEFDLFLAPHHCSWTFFSEEPSENQNPDDGIVDFLSTKKREGAIVICSCKPIKDDDDNPPHYIAYEKYKEIFGDEHVLCTMEEPNEENPEPLYFTMSENGPVKDDYPKKGQVASSAALSATITTPRTYGGQ